MIYKLESSHLFSLFGWGFDGWRAGLLMIVFCIIHIINKNELHRLSVSPFNIWLY